MKRKPAILSLAVLFLVLTGLTGCAELPGGTDVDTAGKSELGALYSLQEAYDEGMLAADDLRNIAYYHNGGNNNTGFTPIPREPANLSNATENAVKETYAAVLRKETRPDGALSFPDITANDVSVLGYYGTYSGAVAVKIAENVTFGPAVIDNEEKRLEIAGAVFTYTGRSSLAVWKAKDSDNKSAKLEVSSDPASVFFTGYFSDTDTFDVHDVTLTFYYGSGLGGESDIAEKLEIDGNRAVSVYFWQEKIAGQSEPAKTLITTLSEKEFYTPAYVMVHNAETGGREPAHQEVLTVPEHYFSQEFGHVGFTVETEENKTGSMGGGVGIYYRREGDTVTLFKNFGDWRNQQEGKAAGQTNATIDAGYYEIEADDMVDCSSFSYFSIRSSLGSPIKLKYADERARFHCVVDNGNFLINSEYVKNATLKSGDGFRWRPYEKDGTEQSNNIVERAFVEIILKTGKNIVGYAIVEMYHTGNPQIYMKARTLRSAVFPKVKGEYQNITEAQVKSIMERIKDANKNQPAAQ